MSACGSQAFLNEYFKLLGVVHSYHECLWYSRSSRGAKADNK